MKQQKRVDSFFLVVEKKSGLFCRENNPMLMNLKSPRINVYMMLHLIEQHVSAFMVAAIIVQHTL